MAGSARAVDTHAVQLAATVVGDHDAIGTELDRITRVIGSRMPLITIGPFRIHSGPSRKWRDRLLPSQPM